MPGWSSCRTLLTMNSLGVAFQLVSGLLNGCLGLNHWILTYTAGCNPLLSTTFKYAAVYEAVCVQQH